jgi:hypothetical protein
MIRVTAGSGSIEVVATAATPDEVDVITREVIKMTLEDAVERIRSALLRAPNG